MIFAVAPTDVIFIMDMDVIAPLGLLDWALGRLGPVRESCLVINAFPRLALRCPFPCPHPAIMLVSRLSYWHFAGCDEDLVGRYGGTDPLFRYKTAIARSCTTIQAKDLGGLPPLEVIPHNSGQRKPRQNGNKEIGLIAAKKNGTRPWATSVLRFSWHTSFSTVQAATIKAPAPAQIDGVPIALRDAARNATVVTLESLATDLHEARARNKGLAIERDRLKNTLESVKAAVAGVQPSRTENQ